jgi:hypothetical protein
LVDGKLSRAIKNIENLGLQIKKLDSNAPNTRSRGASAKSTLSKKVVNHVKSKSIPAQSSYSSVPKINYAKQFERVRTKKNSAVVSSGKKAANSYKYINSISNTDQSYPRLQKECSQQQSVHIASEQ